MGCVNCKARRKAIMDAMRAAFSVRGVSRRLSQARLSLPRDRQGSFGLAEPPSGNGVPDFTAKFGAKGRQIGDGVAGGKNGGEK